MISCFDLSKLTDMRFLESEYAKDELAPTLNECLKLQVPLKPGLIKILGKL